MKSYPQIAMRVFNTPLLLLPEKAETIASVLAERLGIAPMLEIEPLAAQVRGAVLDDADPFADRDRPYQVINGTAVVPVIGELVNRGSFLKSLSGLTSYQGVGEALRSAVADGEVQSIVLDVDSPGGEAAGAMETGALVRKLSAEKPITAYVNGAAASAGYAIAAGAPKVVVAPSATLGSIGAVWLHLDRSQQMAKAGLKPTIIKKGAYKTDGTGLEPLPDDARSRIDAHLDVLYGLFLSSVSMHRPSMSINDAKATEAGLFIGQHAVAAGLADAVGTLEDAIQTSKPKRTATFALKGAEGTKMTDISKADHEAALASAATTNLKAGATGERDRVKAILGSEEAKGREALAQHFAFETDMAPEAAVAAMKASPKAEAATVKESRLDGKVPAPKVDPDLSTKTEMSEYEQGAAAAKAALTGR